MVQHVKVTQGHVARVKGGGGDRSSQGMQKKDSTKFNTFTIKTPSHPWLLEHDPGPGHEAGTLQHVSLLILLATPKGGNDIVPI